MHYVATLVDKKFNEIVYTQFADISKNVSKNFRMRLLSVSVLAVTVHTICCNITLSAFCSQVVFIFLKKSSNYLFMIAFILHISPWFIAATCFGQSTYNS